MKVLLCGASGFIGKQITQALTLAGHQVVPARSGRHGAQHAGLVVDFNQDTNSATWVPRLVGIDAVVNAVGVLRDTRQRPIQAIHEATPKALFDACAQAGVRRVIQISALGIEGSQTRYAQTKMAADQHLLRYNADDRLDGIVLRPSIVFGAGGDSSKLFMGLAYSPALLLPQAVIQARVQPVAVQDLALVVSQLLGPALSVKGVLACVGPTPLTLADFVACLRTQLGKRPARTAALPDILTRLSARIGDQIPSVPWCSESLAMLGQDNVAPAQPFVDVLGRAPVAPADLLKTSWR